MTTRLDADAYAQLLAICREIATRNLSLDQWSAVESSDDFQTDRLVGGFDSIERLFTFSYSDPSGAEWWFDLTLEEAIAAVGGEELHIELRSPQ